MIETAISSLAVSILTQVVKKVPSIPINEGHKLAIRGLAVGLSLVSTIILAWLSGQLNIDNLQPIIGQTVVTYIGSVLAYYGFVK